MNGNFSNYIPNPYEGGNTYNYFDAQNKFYQQQNETGNYGNQYMYQKTNTINNQNSQYSYQNPNNNSNFSINNPSMNNNQFPQHSYQNSNNINQNFQYNYPNMNQNMNYNQQNPQNYPWMNNNQNFMNYGNQNMNNNNNYGNSNFGMNNNSNNISNFSNNNEVKNTCDFDMPELPGNVPIVEKQDSNFQKIKEIIEESDKKANELTEKNIDLNFFEITMESNKLKQRLNNLISLINQKMKSSYGFIPEINKIIQKIESIQSKFIDYSSESFFSYLKKNNKDIKTINLFQFNLHISPVNVYSENKGIFSSLQKFYSKSINGGKKTLLLFGPSGSGKTQIVKAFSTQIKAFFVEIDSYDPFIDIPDFRKDVVQISKYKNNQNNESSGNPVILYFKNIEQFLEKDKISNFNAVFDRVTGDVSDNRILLIFSFNKPLNEIPSEIRKKIIYFHFVGNAQNKLDFIKFFGDYYQIKIDLQKNDENTLNDLLKFYSNKQIIDIIKMIKHERILKESNAGITLIEINNILETIKPYTNIDLFPKNAQFSNLETSQIETKKTFKI